MKEQRTLRSKKLRQFLFERAGGKCQECQTELGQEWHADHIIPWSVSKRTNVFEMQAVCPVCNLRKARKMADRRHQAEATLLAGEIAIGKRTEKGVIADVTPGGGKSRLLTNFARRLLSENIVSHVIWGCPRNALVEQAQDAWKSAGLRQEQLTVVHYGQLESQKKVLLHRCRHERTLFAADELQFLKDADESKNGLWDRNAQLLLEASAKYLGVSGTLFSSSGGELLGVKYYPAEEMRLRNPAMAGLYQLGRNYPDADIRYDLRQALTDKAVTPYSVDMGEVDYTPAGCEEVIRLSDPESDDYRELLKPILHRNSVWEPVIDQMIEKWTAYRRDFYQSNAIVVAASQRHAEEIANYLHHYHNVSPYLATSDQGKDAYENIRLIKEGKFSKKRMVLVTVAMASVGLDLPQATHMAYLNNYRFWGFMLQAWARVSRICYDCGLSPDQQNASIDTIHDTRMKAFVDWIKAQHPVGCFSGERDASGGGGAGQWEPAQLESANVVSNSYETSDNQPGLYGEQADVLTAIRTKIPALANVPASVAMQVAPHIDLTIDKSVCDLQSERKAKRSERTVKDALQKGIDALIKSIAYSKELKDPNEEIKFIRSSLQSGRSIRQFDSIPKLTGLFKKACLLYLDSRKAKNEVAIWWKRKPESSEVEASRRKEKYYVYATECSRVCSELGINLHFFERESRNER